MKRMVQVAKTEKSKAELYREERKQRISNAAKKNAKKSKRHPNAGRVLGRVLGIVLIVAIVCGAGFAVLKSTGVFARAQTAFSVGSHKVSVAEYGYMYYMQYQNTANRAQQSEQQYGYNMYGFDYTKSPEDQDSPSADDDGNPIKWSKQLEDDTVEYMKEFYTLYDNALAAGYTVNDEEKADIDAQIESMRDTASGKNSTQSNAISMSLNSYLKAYYGEGITESFMRKLMEKEMIVQRFSEDKQKEFEDKYTDEALDAEYKKDTSEYDVIDFRMYPFEPETLEAKEGETAEALQKRQDAENAKAMEKAEALLAKVTDEESFKKEAAVYIEEKENEENASEAADETAEAAETVDETAEAADDKAADDAKDADKADDKAAEDVKDAEAAEDADETAEAAEDTEEEEKDDHDADTKAYGTAKNQLTGISEDAAKWAFDKARKAGDKKAFADDNGKAYAMYVVKPAYPQPTVDVRHILFMTIDSETQEKLSDEEIAEKKKQAEQLLADWNARDEKDKTEEAFGELAAAQTEDTGSKENGGLYEKVTPGQMVDSFDKWIFDDSRKEGDVEIVESEYGYHVMYYVGNKNLAYRNSLRTTHTQDDYSGWLEEELSKDSVAVTKNDAGMKKGYDRAYKLINATVKSINSSASSASY